MASHTGQMLSRSGPGFVSLAAAVLSMSASCALRDTVAPKDAPGPRGVSAQLSDAPAQDFYVSPSGSPSGDGSFANPWDLATALSGPASVTPGSTIWLRGGTYTNAVDPRGFESTLAGTADAPIVVRQYPGEHATVTNILLVSGPHTWFWGFEVTNPGQVGPFHGVDVHGPGTKLINLVVHDAPEDGIFIWPQATGTEVNGSIVYNNGRTDNLSHGIYCQSATATLLLKDNIVFDNWAYGFHCYAKDGPYIHDIDLEGNVAFNNYVWGVPWDADILVGGTVPASGITVNENYTYRSNFINTAMSADIGGNVVTNEDIVCTNNYFVGGWWQVGAWATATVTGNTLFNFTTGGMVGTLGAVSGQTWNDNTFFGDPTALAWRQDSNAITTFDGWRAETGLADPGTYAGSAPTGVKVVVRPTAYERGRANIIVYNWAQQGTANVDVSGILQPGDRYLVQNAQDFYGPPVASGTYTGGALELPMVIFTPPSPIGVTTAQPAPVTGPTFNVFVLMRTKPGTCTPDADGSVAACTDWHDHDPSSRAQPSPSALRALTGVPRILDARRRPARRMP